MQKLLYVAVIAMFCGVVISGLAVWKPVQFQGLAALMGGFDGARVVHFVMMAGIVGFMAVPLLLVGLVPKTLPPMIVGGPLVPAEKLP